MEDLYLKLTGNKITAKGFINILNQVYEITSLKKIVLVFLDNKIGDEIFDSAEL